MVARPPGLRGRRRRRHAASLSRSSASSTSWKIVERLVVDTALVEVGREPVAREDEIGGLGDAAVGEPVPDVHDLAGPESRDRAALARLAARRAVLQIVEVSAPAVGSRIKAVGDDLDVARQVAEHRLDQLVEAARHDRDALAARAGEADELGEPGPDARFRAHPLDDLLERRTHRRELPPDVVDEPDLAALERRVDLPVDRLVAELPADAVEHVVLGHGAVEVEHQRRSGQGVDRHAFVTVPSNTRANFVSTLKTGRRSRVPGRRGHVPGGDGLHEACPIRPERLPAPCSSAPGGGDALQVPHGRRPGRRALRPAAGGVRARAQRARARPAQGRRQGARRRRCRAQAAERGRVDGQPARAA